MALEPRAQQRPVARADLGRLALAPEPAWGHRRSAARRSRPAKVAPVPQRGWVATCPGAFGPASAAAWRRVLAASEAAAVRPQRREPRSRAAGAQLRRPARAEAVEGPARAAGARFAATGSGGGGGGSSSAAGGGTGATSVGGGTSGSGGGACRARRDLRLFLLWQRGRKGHLDPARGERLRRRRHLGRQQQDQQC